MSSAVEQMMALSVLAEAIDVSTLKTRLLRERREAKNEGDAETVEKISALIVTAGSLLWFQLAASSTREIWERQRPAEHATVDTPAPAPDRDLIEAAEVQEQAAMRAAAEAASVPDDWAPARPKSS